MSETTCYASADIPRALVALLFPFVAIIAAAVILGAKGYSAFEYFSLLWSGELSWARQGVGWIAIVFWIARYFPPAWSALLDGPCLIKGDDVHLILPGARRLRRDEITRVDLHRGLLRKVVHLETGQDRFSLPLIFVRVSSDPLLRSLAPKS